MKIWVAVSSSTTVSMSISLSMSPKNSIIMNMIVSINIMMSSCLRESKGSLKMDLSESRKINMNMIANIKQN